MELPDRVVCIATGQSTEKSSRRTCPNTQTKQRPKFILLFCKEWESQCECVGKLVNHCCVAKTTETERKQRDKQRLWKAKHGLSLQQIRISH